MLARSYLNFKSELDDMGAVLTYCGFVSEAVLVALAETLKLKMAQGAADPNVRKRVFSIFIELVQNVIRYSEDRGKEAAADTGSGGGLIIVGIEGERYYVACGNFIQNENVERLRQRLEHLATLDKQGIREFYRESLHELPDEGSLGATMGLIEIARRSSQPIEYGFEPGDSDHSFFCLKAYV
jgi:hypothetical protein